MTLKPEEIPQAKTDLEMFIIQHLIKQSLLPEEEKLKLQEKQDQDISKAYAAIPETKIINQAHYLKEYMLPKIAKSRGEQSEDYQFYFSLLQSLMYMLAVLGRDGRLRSQIANEKLLREFFQGKCIFYEGELQRYTSMEDLLGTESAQEVMKIFLKNISPK